MTKPVPMPLACHHCGQPIRSRETLAVAGRLLLPLHTTCYRDHARQQPWYRRPGLPINRWRSFFVFNGGLLAFALLLHLLVQPVPAERLPGLAGLLLAPALWLLLARLVSYLSLERHLPRTER